MEHSWLKLASIIWTAEAEIWGSGPSWLAKSHVWVPGMLLMKKVHKRMSSNLQSVYDLKEETSEFGLFLWMQKDNVRNQREHLILLLANSHIRLHPKPEPLNKVCTKLFLLILFVAMIMFLAHESFRSFWCWNKGLQLWKDLSVFVCMYTDVDMLIIRS